MGQKSASDAKASETGQRFGRTGVRADVCADLPSDFGFFLRGQEQFQRNPDSYNGAVRENYTWSQDYTDLELKVPVPKHVVKGKQVSVALGSSSIRVAVLEENGDRVLMEGKFTHKVNTEGSVWSLEPGKCILVSVGGRQTCGGGLRPALGNAGQRAVETLLFMSRGFGVFPIRLLFAGDMWGRAPR